MKKKTFKNFLIGIVIVLLFAGSYQTTFSKKSVTLIDSTESGWETKDGYLEQKLNIGEINYIKCSSDGKHFYTLSLDRVFSTWNINDGKLIDQITFPFYCENISLSPDESKLSIVTWRYYNGTQFDTIKVFDLISRNFINLINPLKYFYGKQNYFFSQHYHNTLMDTDTSFIVYSRLIFGSLFPHSNETIEDGLFIRWSINTGDTIKSLNVLGFVGDLKQSNDRKHFIFTSRYADYNDPNGRFTNYVSIIDNNLNVISNLYKYDTTSNNYQEFNFPITFGKVQFSGDKQNCIGYNWNNELYFWDFTTGDLNRKLKLGAIQSDEYYNNDIAFTKNNKLVIIGSLDEFGACALKIWNISSGSVLDSIKFPGRDYRWKLAVCEDSVSFLSGSSDGIIRLFRNPVINSIDETVKKDLVYLFPNPTSDKLYIQINNIVPGNVTLKLFDIFGREIETIYDGYSDGNLNLEHHISNISSGTYLFVLSSEREKKTVRIVVCN